MMTIRSMVSKDREVLYEMMQNTGVFSVQAINLAMEAIDTYLFNSEENDYRVVVAAEPSGQAVAFACYGPVAGTEGTCRLYWLVVTPAWQHQGIGTQLLEWVEGQMRTEGARLMVLEITSESSHAIFVRFFTERTYKPSGRIRNYFRSGEDILFYVKPLS